MTQPSDALAQRSGGDLARLGDSADFTVYKFHPQVPMATAAVDVDSRRRTAVTNVGADAVVSADSLWELQAISEVMATEGKRVVGFDDPQDINSYVSLVDKVGDIIDPENSRETLFTRKAIAYEDPRGATAIIMYPLHAEMNVRVHVHGEQEPRQVKARFGTPAYGQYGREQVNFDKEAMRTALRGALPPDAELGSQPLSPAELLAFRESYSGPLGAEHARIVHGFDPAMAARGASRTPNPSQQAIEASPTPVVEEGAGRIIEGAVVENPAPLPQPQTAGPTTFAGPLGTLRQGYGIGANGRPTLVGGALAEAYYNVQRAFKARNPELAGQWADWYEKNLVHAVGGQETPQHNELGMRPGWRQLPPAGQGRPATWVPASVAAAFYSDMTAVNRTENDHPAADRWQRLAEFAKQAGYARPPADSPEAQRWQPDQMPREPGRRAARSYQAAEFALDEAARQPALAAYGKQVMAAHQNGPRPNYQQFGPMGGWAQLEKTHPGVEAPAVPAAFAADFFAELASRERNPGREHYLNQQFLSASAVAEQVKEATARQTGGGWGQFSSGGGPVQQPPWGQPGPATSADEQIANGPTPPPPPPGPGTYRPEGY